MNTMILAGKTDSWDVELYLLSEDGVVVEEKHWNAGRNLSRDLLVEIENIVTKNGGDIKNIGYLDGLIAFKGPGSFTGLRIGVSVFNAIAESINIPIVGVQSNNWLDDGVMRLNAGENDKIVIPDYGRAPNITKPKK